MSPRMLLSPDLLHGGPLRHRSTWLAAGVTRRRLASAEFTRLLPGYSARSADPPSLADVCRAVLQRATGAAAAPGATMRTALPSESGFALISGSTAAELHGLCLPRRHQTEHTGIIHLSVLDGRSITSTAYRTIRHDPRGRETPRAQIAGIPVSTVTDALRQIAPTLSHRELVAACDAALDPHRMRLPAMTLEELHHQVNAGLGLGGTPELLRAVADAREDVRSPWETHARVIVRDAGYPDPVPNLRVEDRVTGEVFYLDLAFPMLKIYIEYDGDWHRTDRARFRRDRLKDAILRRLGWEAVRITVDQVVAPAAFLAHLESMWEGRIATA